MRPTGRGQIDRAHSGGLRGGHDMPETCGVHRPAARTSGRQMLGIAGPFRDGRLWNYLRRVRPRRKSGPRASKTSRRGRVPEGPPRDQGVGGAGCPSRPAHRMGDDSVSRAARSIRAVRPLRWQQGRYQRDVGPRPSGAPPARPAQPSRQCCGSQSMTARFATFSTSVGFISDGAGRPRRRGTRHTDRIPGIEAGEGPLFDRQRQA